MTEAQNWLWAAKQVSALLAQKECQELGINCAKVVFKD